MGVVVPQRVIIVLLFVFRPHKALPDKTVYVIDTIDP